MIRLTLLLALLLCSCADQTPQLGAIAAREMGVTFYVSFQKDGHPDSAAVFFWRGQWWVYHPSYGSHATSFFDPNEIPLVAVLTIDGASGPLLVKSTKDVALSHAYFTNGCLPRAIIQCERYGGGIAVEPRHAKYVPQ